MLFQGEVVLCGMTSFTGFQFMALREGEKIPNHRRLGYKGSFRASFIFSFYRRGGLQGPHFAGPQLSDFTNTTETDSLTAETRGNPQPLPAFLVFPRTGVPKGENVLRCPWCWSHLSSSLPDYPGQWYCMSLPSVSSIDQQKCLCPVPFDFTWVPWRCAMKVAVLTEFVAKVFSQNHCPLSCPVTLG